MGEGREQPQLAGEPPGLLEVLVELLELSDPGWAAWAQCSEGFATYEDELHDPSCDLARGAEPLETSPLAAVVAGWWITCGCIPHGRLVDDWVSSERLTASEVLQLRGVTARLRDCLDPERALVLTLRGLHLAASALDAPHPPLVAAAREFRLVASATLTPHVQGRIDTIAAALHPSRPRDLHPLGALQRALRAAPLSLEHPDALLVCSRRLAASEPAALPTLLVELLVPGVDAGVLAGRLVPSRLAASAARSSAAVMVHLPRPCAPEVLELALHLLEDTLPTPTALHSALATAEDALH